MRPTSMRWANAGYQCWKDVGKTLFGHVVVMRRSAYIWVSTITAASILNGISGPGYPAPTQTLGIVIHSLIPNVTLFADHGHGSMIADPWQLDMCDGSAHVSQHWSGRRETEKATVWRIYKKYICTLVLYNKQIFHIAYSVTFPKIEI
jgi:hypothetical protein